MKKITFILAFMVSAFGLLSGQTLINDFESGSPTPESLYGADVSVVTNPNSTGNTSANCVRLGRTTGQWFQLMRFTLATPYVINAGETKYLHALINYPAVPDISIRFDGTTTGSNGDLDGAVDNRALNDYTDVGQWQDMVYQIDGGASGATVSSIVMIFDAGFQNMMPFNESNGQILNNTTDVAYADQFNFSDSATPLVLSTDEFESNNTVSFYPNPTSSTVKIASSSENEITQLDIFNSVGQKVASQKSASGLKEFDMSGLASGLYFVKLEDALGRSVTQKLLKN